MYPHRHVRLYRAATAWRSWYRAYRLFDGYGRLRAALTATSLTRVERRRGAFG